MKVTAGGVEIPMTGNTLVINVEVNDNGETMVPIEIHATGGRLDIYRSQVRTTGNIRYHLLGEEGEGQKATNPSGPDEEQIESPAPQAPRSNPPPPKRVLRPGESR